VSWRSSVSNSVPASGYSCGPFRSATIKTLALSGRNARQSVRTEAVGGWMVVMTE
jgi:hypothetical protein